MTLHFVFTPDKISVADYLLDAKGAQRYTNREIVKITPAKIRNGQYSFILKKHMASALSNVIHKGTKDYRGFLVTARAGNFKKTYAFVLKTEGFDS